MMKIPFLPPLISGFEASLGSLASGLTELTKGPYSFFSSFFFFFFFPSSHISLGVDSFCINLEDLFVKNVYGLKKNYFFFFFH